VAIAHDTATRFPATDGPSGTNSVDTTTGDRTFSHAGAAGAKGAVVVLNCTGTTSTVTGVLYGGTAMSLDTSITDTSEAGRVEIWVLGDLTGLGGTQTVTLQGCTATDKWATCSTVTAATSLVKVHQRGSLGGATLDTTRQLTLVTTVTTMSYCGVHQGNAAPGTNVATGNTLQYQNDYGALSSMSARRTSADAAGSIVVGFNAAAASDDRCIAAVALQEYTPKTTAATIAETPAESTWTGTGTSKSTSTGGNGSGTVSWQAGDTVYVFGATAQASSTTLGTPTHSGANLPAFAAVGAAVGSGSQCWAHTWSAVATGSGSSVISETATSSADPWGIIAWVVRGSDGTGTRASDVSAAKTVSLTRSDAHSLVFEIIADYAAGSVSLTWTPSGQTQREATQSAGLYSVGVADWGDQGSAGATSYGVSAGFDATGPLTKIALEILGTVGGDVTITATTVNAVAAVPVPTKQTGSTVTAATVAAAAGVPAPTVSLGAAITATAVGAIAVVPAPAVSTGSTVIPTTVAAVAAVPTPTPQAGSTVTAATVAAVAAIPAPTVTTGGGSATVTATAVAAVAGIPALTAQAGSTVTATTVNAVAAVPAPTKQTGSTVTATSVAAAVAIPLPAVSAGGSVTIAPTAIAALAAIPVPTLHTGQQVTAAAVTAQAAIPAPTIALSTVITPAAVAALAAVPLPTFHMSVLVPTFSVAAVATIPTPEIVFVSPPDLNPLRVTITERSFAVTFTEPAGIIYQEG